MTYVPISIKKSNFQEKIKTTCFIIEGQGRLNMICQMQSIISRLKDEMMLNSEA